MKSNKIKILLGLLAFTLSLSSYAVTRLVTSGDPVGNPYYLPGNPSGSFMFVFGEANSGDTIKIDPLVTEIQLATHFLRLASKNNITIIGNVDAVTGLPVTVIKASTSNVDQGAITFDGVSNIYVSNFIIENSRGIGVKIENGSGNTVSNVIVKESQKYGVYINNSDNASVNSSFVSGSQLDGIYVQKSENVVLFKNVIGIDEDGVVNPNVLSQNTASSEWSGVRDYTDWAGGPNLEMAGVLVKESPGVLIRENIISGNIGHGVNILDTDNSSSNPSVIIDNFIGYSLDSLNGVGNFAEGILVKNSSNVHIGYEYDGLGTDDFHGNYIVANGNRSSFIGGDPALGASTGAQVTFMHGHGVEVQISDNVTVVGNIVGYDKDGLSSVGVDSEKLGNQLNGIYINGSNDVTVGGCTKGAANYVGGNGFEFEDVHTNDSEPENNLYLYGVRHGIQIHDGVAAAYDVTVLGNVVGLGVDDITSVPNGEDGVSVLGYYNKTYDVEVGTCDCGNRIDGANFGVAFQGSENSGSSILNNYITGTKAAAVKLQSGTSNTTVGTAACPNTIVDNEGDGVIVIGDGDGNDISGNIISCNGGSGVVLEEDKGANDGNLYSYINTGNGNNELNGVVIVPLDSTLAPNQAALPNQRIDIYIGDTACTDAYICQKHKEDIPTLAKSPQSSGALKYITSVETVFDTTTYKNVLDSSESVSYKVIGTWVLEITPAMEALGLTTENAVVSATDGNGNTSELNVCVNIPPCEAPINLSVIPEDLTFCEGDIPGATITASADDGGTIAGEIIYALYADGDFTTKLDTNTSGVFMVTSPGDFVVRAFDSRSEESCSIDSEPFTIASRELPKTGLISRIIPNDSICPGDAAIEFKVESEAGLTYEWSIASGDAVIVPGTETLETTSVNFGDTGNVVLHVIATQTEDGLTCVDDTASSLSIVINDLPSGNAILGNDTVNCSQNDAVYTVVNAGVGSSFSWLDLPQGAKIVASNGPDSSEVTIDFDVYFGDIIVREQNQYGCFGSEDTLSIVQTGCALKAVIDPNAAQYCFGDAISFTSNSVISFPVGQMTYSWSVIGATPSSGSGLGLEDFAITVPAPGDYNINLEVEDPFSNTHDTTITITVKALPVITSADLVYEDVACPNTSDTIAVFDDDLGATYSIDNLSFTTDTSWIVDYTSGGAFDFIVYKDLNGCKSQVAGQVAVMNEPAKLEIIQPADICANTEYTLDLSAFDANSTYVWLVPTGASIVGDTDGSSVTVSFGSTGGDVSVYEITDFACASLKQGDTTTVTVKAAPVKPVIVGDVTVCSNEEGEFNVLNASSTSQFNWTIKGASGQIEIDDQTSISIDVDGNTTVQVIEFNETGCSTASDVLAVTSVGIPEKPILITPDTMCEQSSSVQFKLETTDGSAFPSNTIINWADIDDLQRLSGGGNSPLITLKANDGGSRTIGITLTDSNSCKESWEYDVMYSYFVEDATIYSPGRICDYRDEEKALSVFTADAKYADWYEWSIDDIKVVKVLNPEAPEEFYVYDITDSISPNNNVLNVRFDVVNELGNNRLAEITVKAFNECSFIDVDEIRFLIEESRELDIVTIYDESICVDDSIRIEVKTTAGSLQEWADDTTNIFEIYDYVDGVYYPIVGDLFPRYQIAMDTIIDSVKNIYAVYDTIIDTVLEPHDTTIVVTYDLDRYGYDHLFKSFDYVDSVVMYSHYYALDTIHVNNTRWYESVQDGDTLVDWLVTDRCVITAESDLIDTNYLKVIYPLEFTAWIQPANENSSDPKVIEEENSDFNLFYTSQDLQDINLFIELNQEADNFDNIRYDYTWTWGWKDYLEDSEEDSLNTTGISPFEGEFKFPSSEAKAKTPRVDLVEYVAHVYTDGICPSRVPVYVGINYSLWIPSIFSPSPGREFPVWKIDNADLFPNLSIQVFNRWGTLVYEKSGGYDNDWDGVNSITGQALPDATYFYIINTDPANDDENIPFEGSVTIVR